MANKKETGNKGPTTPVVSPQSYKNTSSPLAQKGHKREEDEDEKTLNAKASKTTSPAIKTPSQPSSKPNSPYYMSQNPPEDDEDDEDDDNGDEDDNFEEEDDEEDEKEEKSSSKKSSSCTSTYGKDQSLMSRQTNPINQKSEKDSRRTNPTPSCTTSRTGETKPTPSSCRTTSCSSKKNK